MASQISNWIMAADEQEKELTDKIRSIDHYYIPCESKDEKYAAVALVAAITGLITKGHAITFCRNDETANWLVAKLTENGHSCALLTGENGTVNGVDINDGLKGDAKEKMWITTDLKAKGAIVTPVTVVVNYDLPYDDTFHEADYETYYRRIERVQIGGVGRVISLVHSPKSMRIITSVRNRLRFPLASRKADDIAQLF